MRKLQNCLYITTQGTYIHKERETILIECNRKKLLQIPVHSISGLFCFGNVLLSPAVMGFCGENNIHLAFFTEHGRFLGRLHGVQTGNVLLRRAQYHADENKGLNIARVIIGAKIQSSRGVLQRFQRNNGKNLKVEEVIKWLNRSLIQAKTAASLETLRGIEGDAAAKYFSVFGNLVKQEMQDNFFFNGRNRRPPRDPINAMLSFVYSIVSQNISGALAGVGLDPQVGFLHSDRPGRDSLAQDLLEEFRAWMCDRLVLSIINRKQVASSDFIIESSGAIRMKDEVKKIILTELQLRKQETINHPFLGEPIEIGLLPHIQALLLARHLRGDLEYYPPFYVR
ncbi:type I-C CRISPR-associated endonuclease Cas1c [Legionella sp. 16cNR16C]|uniref:type I-C CRISPR-associated endonuclease Cas1c n=1 Tax=Legionella sp. 16cNR16C TaxID=2905656 RepID=UPI001E4B419D|nr:type I-C CRISPR-associated endonuclease Cas1c [Legionella sp. 16cNR16C]MCE3045731.1 type I-C CRISPR-associated endonuclease Cas1c [Legionella sp. 16cNR16C]